MTIDRLYELTNIDRWFLHKFKNISNKYTELQAFKGKVISARIHVMFNKIQAEKNRYIIHGVVLLRVFESKVTKISFELYLFL